MSTVRTALVPAQEICAWLVQMGQRRGGMYGYDWLENAVGLDVHTTGEIREEWQHLAVGDRVVVAPEGWGPLPDGYSFRVAVVEPPRAPVLRQAPSGHPWNGVWSFHVVDAGEGHCRLLARSRTEVPASAGAHVAGRVLEPVTLVMTRRMLHGTRQRAEDSAGRARGAAGAPGRPKNRGSAARRP